MTLNFEINFANVFSKCVTCNKRTSELPAIENNMCDYCMPKLHMVCVGACMCDGSPFILLLEMSHKITPFDPMIWQVTFQVKKVS